MKLIQLIKEIGEANPNKAYPYELDGERKSTNGDLETYKYSFETEGTEDHLPLRYVVSIAKEIEIDSGRELANYDVTFAVRLMNGQLSFDTETDRGQLYRVMATVVKILKDRIEEDKNEGQIPKIIRFYPSKTKGEGDDRRAKLYAAYAKTQLPNSEIRKTPSEKGLEIVLN